MTQLDPERNEAGTVSAVWWVALLALAIMWVGAFYFAAVDWCSIVLGAVSGGLFVTWWIDQDRER